MEGVANSVEDRLVDGLSFQLKPGASYVTERKSVTYHPQGSNIYSTNGTKLIKLLLTGDQWLDPNTFRIMFDLRNMDGNANKLLRPLGGPHTFFRRMRILANGAVIEDIDNYNRVHEMFKTLGASDARINDKAEDFGQQYNKDTSLNTTNLSGIKGGQSQTVLFKPCSGLLNQPKMLPIRYMPLTIELEMVHDPNEPIVSTNGAASESGLSDGFSLTSNTTTSWQIENVQVKVDVVTLDNQLDNSYAEHLLEGKALPINYHTYVSQTQNILSGNGVGQQKVRLNVTRALSRLKSVYITLDHATTPNNVNEAVMYKSWNSFYSPMNADNEGELNVYDQNREIADFQVQVGSKLFPEYPIRSHAEAYYQLRKTLGHHDQHNSFDITQAEYRCRKFILGIDMEKVLEAGYTGINTRAGDLMNIRFDHASTNNSTYATSMQIVLTSDQILEVRDSGVQVFD